MTETHEIYISRMRYHVAIQNMTIAASCMMLANKIKDVEDGIPRGFSSKGSFTDAMNFHTAAERGYLIAREFVMISELIHKYLVQNAKFEFALKSFKERT